MRIFILLFTLFISVPTIAHALEVSPDGPLIINLREDIKSVIVGNPAHAAVSLENSKMLVLTAGMPGMTSLTVLGAGGKVLMNEKVIVDGPNKEYVRIKNACVNQTGGACQEMKMYYCKEGTACHNVVVAEEAPAVSTQNTVEGGNIQYTTVPPMSASAPPSVVTQ